MLRSLDRKRQWGSALRQRARKSSSSCDPFDGDRNGEGVGYFGVGGNGLFRGRPDDRFGIAYLRLGVSRDLKNELAPIFRLRDEWTVEAFYNVAVTPWLRITGNVQYARPAVGSVPRALYAGIGTYTCF